MLPSFLPYSFVSWSKSGLKLRPPPRTGTYQSKLFPPLSGQAGCVASTTSCPTFSTSIQFIQFILSSLHKAAGHNRDHVSSWLSTTPSSLIGQRHMTTFVLLSKTCCWSSLWVFVAKIRRDSLLHPCNQKLKAFFASYVNCRAQTEVFQLYFCTESIYSR